MTRRRWLTALAGAAAAGCALDAFAVEPFRVTVTRHRFGTARGGPVARIVQLTDLHLRAVGRHAERVAAAVAGLAPQLIVLTGDSLDRAGNVGLLARFLALLPVGVPAFAILGNWEHKAGVDLRALARAYERAGVRLLVNESATLRLPGAELLVTGLDDLVDGAPDLRVALSGVEPRENHLLLAHCPAHRDVLEAAAAGLRRVDPRLLAPGLMLAGHTHGGQVAPLGWAPVLPDGSGRYVRGWYRDRPTALYVSRGIGTSTLPARLGAPPEVACVEWALAS